MVFARFAEYVYQRTDNVKARPAYVEPIEAPRGTAHEKVQNQVRAGTHEQAREGDKLKAIEGRGPVKFG